MSDTSRYGVTDADASWLPRYFSIQPRSVVNTPSLLALMGQTEFDIRLTLQVRTESFGDERFLIALRNGLWSI